MRLRQALAARLRELMDRTPGLSTQVQVAKESGMAQTTVGRILKCQVAATLDNVEALADAYQVSPGDLLTVNAHDGLLKYAPKEGGLSAEDQRTMERFAAFLAIERGSVSARTSIRPQQNQAAAIQKAAGRAERGKPIERLEIPAKKRQRRRG